MYYQRKGKRVTWERPSGDASKDNDRLQWLVNDAITNGTEIHLGPGTWTLTSPIEAFWYDTLVDGFKLIGSGLKTIIRNEIPGGGPAFRFQPHRGSNMSVSAVDGSGKQTLTTVDGEFSSDIVGQTIKVQGFADADNNRNFVVTDFVDSKNVKYVNKFTGDDLSVSAPDSNIQTLTDADYTFSSDDVGKTIVISDFVDPNNNGSFVILSRSGETITYLNASGSAETGVAAADWLIQGAAEASATQASWAMAFVFMQGLYFQDITLDGPAVETPTTHAGIYVTAVNNFALERMRITDFPYEALKMINGGSAEGDSGQLVRWELNDLYITYCATSRGYAVDTGYSAVAFGIWNNVTMSHCGGGGFTEMFTGSINNCSFNYTTHRQALCIGRGNASTRQFTVSDCWFEGNSNMDIHLAAANDGTVERCWHTDNYSNDVDNIERYWAAYVFGSPGNIDRSGTQIAMSGDEMTVTTSDGAFSDFQLGGQCTIADCTDARNNGIFRILSVTSSTVMVLENPYGQAVTEAFTVTPIGASSANNRIVQPGVTVGSSTSPVGFRFLKTTTTDLARYNQIINVKWNVTTNLTKWVDDGTDPDWINSRSELDGELWNYPPIRRPYYFADGQLTPDLDNYAKYRFVTPMAPITDISAPDAGVQTITVSTVFLTSDAEGANVYILGTTGDPANNDGEFTINSVVSASSFTIDNAGGSADATGSGNMSFTDFALANPTGGPTTKYEGLEFSLDLRSGSNFINQDIVYGNEYFQPKLTRLLPGERAFVTFIWDSTATLWRTKAVERSHTPEYWAMHQVTNGSAAMTLTTTPQIIRGTQWNTPSYSSTNVSTGTTPVATLGTNGQRLFKVDLQCTVENTNVNCLIAIGFQMTNSTGTYTNVGNRSLIHTITAGDYTALSTTAVIEMDSINTGVDPVSSTKIIPVIWANTTVSAQVYSGMYNGIEIWKD